MNLPQGWTIEKFTSVIEIYDNLRKPINNSERELRINGKPADKLFPYYGATGQIGYIDDYITDGEYVLLGEDGAPFLNPYTNKAYIINGKTWVNNHAHVLKSKYNNKFIFYYLNYFTYNGYVTGTTRLKLTQSDMKRIPIINPPVQEQQRIVAKIDSLFSELDNGITLLKTIKTQLAVYRQAVLKWAFEGKNFKLIKMNQISETFGGGAFKSNDFILSGKYQVIRIGNVRPGIIRYNERPIFLNKLNKNESKYLLEKGDVVITLTGTRKKRDYGFTAIIDKENLVLNQRVAAIRFFQDYTPKFFLYYSWTNKFKDDFFKDETGNVGQGNVGMKAITETFIPYCPLPEQQAIVSAIESRLSVCDKLEQTIDQTLALSASLRQSILKKAFEGRLVPQDPNDEPAEKLLERIRAEKAEVLANQKQRKTKKGLVS